MTVPTSTAKSGPYAGAGTTGPFTVGFRFLENSHLQVIRTSTLGLDSTLTLTTDYTVTGAGGASGTVTLVTALTSGEKLTIIRDVPFTQEADYVQNDAFPAESHERALDKLTMEVQQVAEEVGRALTLPATVSGVSTVLPTPEANKVIAWNPTANALQNLNVNEIASIVAYGTAASDIFTGTGSQTLFVLSSNPGALNNLDVSIGGVTQLPGIDYTWSSGTTVTFTTAPVLGATVLIRYMQALALGTADAGSVQYTPAGTGAVATTVQAKLRESVSVTDFGAKGDGSTDDTAAINAAITYAKSLAYGCEVFFPVGSYAVTEINATSLTVDFTKAIVLRGAGRLVTRIVPFSSGKVLLNMLGSNNMQVQGMTFDSTTLASQAAIFMARSTTSPNCNNNRFRDVFTEGSYTVAPIVCNGSESTNWFDCRFANSNAAANYCCFRSGGQVGVQALQGITVVNGGTILDSNNPNTDNKMFGVEFYSPYSSAYIVKFDYSAGYAFFGCTIVGGTANNMRMVSYQAYAAGSNTFIGPVSWFGCHFEVFGSNNTAHWLNGNGSAVSYFNGINSYGGIYQCGDVNVFGVVDFNRVNLLENPIFRGCTWTTPTSSAGSVGKYSMYLGAIFSSSITFKPNEGDGQLYLFQYAASSAIDVYSLIPAGTRFVACIHNSTAAALPTSGTYCIGETIQRETPVVGQPIGWKVTVGGTLGTLNGGATTGTGAINTNALSLNSASGLTEGCAINIAGAGGPYRVRKLTGATAYLDINLVAGVSGAAVSFSNPTLVAMANL